MVGFSREADDRYRGCWIKHINHSEGQFENKNQCSNKALFAKVGLVITSIKFVIFLTSKIASKSDANHLSSYCGYKIVTNHGNNLILVAFIGIWVASKAQLTCIIPN